MCSEDGRQCNPGCRGTLALSLPELESSVALGVLGPLSSASLDWGTLWPTILSLSLYILTAALSRLAPDPPMLAPPLGILLGAGMFWHPLEFG